jgi:putative tryptophan/tyrosine transport system substrate-binding protein
MKRRDFLRVICGAAATWPLAARAQGSSVPKVGYVYVGERGTDISGPGLRQGLADKGYEIGRNLVLEDRYADGNSDKVPALIDELLALKVDVLVTVGTFATLAARRATSSVPIVFASGDPVKTGIAASLNRPGGNATGVSILASDYSAKWLELMKEALPKLARVAVLWNPENPSVVGEVEQLRTGARSLGLDPSLFLGRSKEIEGSFAAIATGAFDGLVVTTDPSLESLTPRIIAFAAEHRLPTLYPFSTAVQQGGLMSYSTDFFDMWRRAASYVDRILKGESPAELPIEQATRVALKLNLKTAKTLGLRVPPTLLARADEVIE